jgi:hypothetical protein
VDITDRITMPIPQFLAAAGIGRTKLYELIGSGELGTVVLGRRRLIVVRSYLELIARRQEAEATKTASATRTATPHRRGTTAGRGSDCG